MYIVFSAPFIAITFFEVNRFRLLFSTPSSIIVLELVNELIGSFPEGCNNYMTAPVCNQIKGL